MFVCLAIMIAQVGGEFKRKGRDLRVENRELSEPILNLESSEMTNTVGGSRTALNEKHRVIHPERKHRVNRSERTALDAKFA